MPQCLTANDQGQDLAASDAAHTGNDGHEYSKSNHLFDGFIEQADDGGGGQCGKQVDAKPDSSTAAGFQRRSKGIFFFIQTHGTHQRVVRGFPDNVNHVIDGDTTDEFTLCIDNRSRYKVVSFEQFGNVCVLHGGRNHPGVGGHHLTHGLVGITDKKLVDGQDANKFVIPVYDQEVIRHFWQRRVTAQVTHNNFERDVRTDGHRIGVHQTTGAVLRVAQYLFKTGTVLLVHCVEYFLGNAFRKLLQDVGDIIGVEV